MALPDGRVLSVGGCISPVSTMIRSYFCDLGLTDSAEVWDPDTASFGPAGSLAVKRGGHTATALPDGRVLVVGGRVFIDPTGDDEIVYASAEIWDPSDG